MLKTPWTRYLFRYRVVVCIVIARSHNIVSVELQCLATYDLPSKAEKWSQDSLMYKDSASSHTPLLFWHIITVEMMSSEVTITHDVCFCLLDIAPRPGHSSISCIFLLYPLKTTPSLHSYNKINIELSWFTTFKEFFSIARNPCFTLGNNDE